MQAEELTYKNIHMTEDGEVIPSEARREESQGSPWRRQTLIQDNPVGLEKQAAGQLLPELDELQASFWILYHQYHKHHWLVEGPQFMELHKFLEHHYEEVHEHLDDLAERMTALGGIPTSDPVNQAKIAFVTHEPEGTYRIRTSLEHDRAVERHLAVQLRGEVGLARLGGKSVGIIANQPRTRAGTLDIEASRKAARHVQHCDVFNLPILTFVDTPGFEPGKDLEWRGMIRHGAQLVYAYARATVPRICVILRKSYGGAYIVMDSKTMGNDVCLAWPWAELAVMGAGQAAAILQRRARCAIHPRSVRSHASARVHVAHVAACALTRPASSALSHFSDAGKYQEVSLNTSSLAARLRTIQRHPIR